MLQLFLFLFAFHFTYATTLFSNELTLEEKVGQLLLVHFTGEEANEDARFLIQDIKVGGIIYFNWANGLNSPEQIQCLSQQLQKLALSNQHPIPLFIAADQEGGLVTRFSKGFTVFPGNRALGITDNTEFAKKSAYVIGSEMMAVGTNMNLAPDVDINNNPLNPVIGIRSFGPTEEIVTRFGRAALQGYQQSGVITTLKHFPGHGNVTTDSHSSLPILNTSKESLLNNELQPFIRLKDQCDMIMTAHLMVPALDPVHCSTLSKATLEGLLRTELGFQGIIISDSLVMAGVLNQTRTIEEAAVQALNAGCDILCIGGAQLDVISTGEKQQLTPYQIKLQATITDIQKTHQAIIQAVREGRISENRIDQSVARILALKKSHLQSKPSIAINEINSTESQQLAQSIATAALQIFNDHLSPYSLKSKSMEVIAPELVPNQIETTPGYALFISENQAQTVADKIWQNEGSKKKENLTVWNQGEDFASLGIGHFIWYPSNQELVFKQTFPSLLIYLEKHKITIPEWVAKSESCPWQSRDQFYQDIQTVKMKELREFLFETRKWQALFMAERLEQSLPNMLFHLPVDQKEQVSVKFYRLFNNPNGLYALIDYLNFKGEGTASRETYKGQGWGLLQVLIAIPQGNQTTVSDFVKAAKEILTNRVANSPIERNEQRWLKGWLNRLDTYLDFKD